MDIPASLVKTLREKSGAGMMDCKNALVEMEGDLEKALDHLRQKGLADAANKAGRTATEGLVYAYIHAGGKIGVLLEVNCETDFVALTPQFQEFVKDVAMQVAAAGPLCVRREDLPPEVIAREREVYAGQARETGKPENILNKIVELGENISIRRFSRFQVGEGLEHEEKNLAEEVQQQIASA